MDATDEHGHILLACCSVTIVLSQASESSEHTVVCAGPDGAAGYCDGKCCSGDNSTCVDNLDLGGVEKCCALTVLCKWLFRLG